MNWNPGKLLIYNRAELKTSDHRPVMAILDIDVLSADTNKRKETFNKVISAQGPTDSTIVVSLESITEINEINENTITTILEKLGEVGTIILVRFQDNNLLVTYDSGKGALAAIDFNNEMINQDRLVVRLLTPDWQSQIDQELSLIHENTARLNTDLNNSLLGEDFNIPTMSFDIEDDDEDSSSLSTLCSSSNEVEKSLDDKSLMGRVPPPRPQAPSIKETLESGINNESAKQTRAPPRPAAPPSRPPPPQRSTVNASPMPDVIPTNTKDHKPAQNSKQAKSNPRSTRLPLRPHINPLSTTSIGHISRIGLPTQVKHTGHASNEDEAKMLIESLMPTNESTNNTFFSNPTHAPEQYAPKDLPDEKKPDLFTFTSKNDGLVVEPSTSEIPKPPPRLIDTQHNTTTSSSNEFVGFVPKVNPRSSETISSSSSHNDLQNLIPLNHNHTLSNSCSNLPNFPRGQPPPIPANKPVAMQSSSSAESFKELNNQKLSQSCLAEPESCVSVPKQTIEPCFTGSEKSIPPLPKPRKDLENKILTEQPKQTTEDKTQVTCINPQKIPPVPARVFPSDTPPVPPRRNL